jgi:hypothetical protein
VRLDTWPRYRAHTHGSGGQYSTWSSCTRNREAEPDSLVVRVDLDDRVAELLIADLAVYYVTDSLCGLQGCPGSLTCIKPDSLRDPTGHGHKFVTCKPAPRAPKRHLFLAAARLWAKRARHWNASRRRGYWTAR